MQLSKKEVIGFLQQANWATPQAANANFITWQWIQAGTVNPNPDVMVDEFNSTSQLGTHFEWERVYVDSKSGLPTLPFSGVCDISTLAPILVAALQEVIEGGSSPYLKTITSGGGASPIDFNGNAGYVFTFAIKRGASADDGIKLHNGVIQTLNIVCDLNARGFSRLLSYNGTLIFNEVLEEQTLSGTWTNSPAVKTGFLNDTDTFSFGTFTIDSVDYAAQCLKRWELQINNNIYSDCKTTGGKANQYKMSPQYNLLLRLDHNATTEKIHNDYIQGARVNAVIQNNVNSSTAKHFQLTMPYGLLTSPPKIYDGDYLGLDLNVKLFANAGSAVMPVSLSYADGKQWGYPTI